MDRAAGDPLRAIRSRIDAIDEEMHRLLIERSGVIAELIQVKGLSKPGAAFRPDREADMMRRLVMRHEGNLPLVTVEHIWREIITAFTAMQAPFGVAAGPAQDALALRDAIRFNFGFSVPIACCESARAAVARVAASSRDIAVIPADSDEPWWEGLAGAGAPKIFAKLPFIELADRPAGMPAYVVGPPIKQGSPPDVLVFAVQENARLGPAVASMGGTTTAAGDHCLVELPVAATPDEVEREAGESLGAFTPLGGFFQPIRLMAERTGARGSWRSEARATP